MTKMAQEEWEASVQWVGIVAGCVIERDGKYLLVQEKQPKAYGLWNLPAGYVDKGEDIESAAIREAKEETGLEVKLAGEIGVWHEDVKRPVKHAFRAIVVGGDLLAQGTGSWDLSRDAAFMRIFCRDRDRMPWHSSAPRAPFRVGYPEDSAHRLEQYSRTSGTAFWWDRRVFVWLFRPRFLRRTRVRHDR